MIRPRNAQGRPSGHPRDAQPARSLAAQPAAGRTTACEKSRRRWRLPIVSLRAYERDVLAAFAVAWTQGLGARIECGAA
jgi:hypothetical protein